METARCEAVLVPDARTWDVAQRPGSDVTVGAALTPAVTRAIEDVARELVLAARAG